MVSGGGAGLVPAPSPMVRNGTRTYVLVKAGNIRCGAERDQNRKIWSGNAPFWVLSERFGRGSVSNRSAAADAVRAFVVPFNSVSVVPARPAMGFRVLPAARRSRACGRCGLPGSWWSPARPAARRVPPKARLPYFSPRQRPSVDLQALPQLVHIGQDVLGEVLVHRWRLMFLSAGMAPAGKPWTPGKGAGRPSDRNAGRPARPAATRMASGHDNPSMAQNEPYPWSGTGRQTPPPCSPSGPADSKAGRPQPKPRPSHTHKIWRPHP